MIEDPDDKVDWVLRELWCIRFYPEDVDHDAITVICFLPQDLLDRLRRRMSDVEYYGIVQPQFWAEQPMMLFRMISKLMYDVEDRNARVENQVREAVSQRTLVDPKALVYYIRFGDRIKIGTTTNLANRLTALPFDEVLAVEPGSHFLERSRHKQFAHLRIKGEWFRAEDELLRFIEGLQQDAA